MWIDDEAALKALYGAVGEASIAKEVPHLTPAYRALVEASPFCVLATAGPEGLDDLVRPKSRTGRQGHGRSAGRNVSRES